MNTNQSIKAYLDSLSQLPGSILYRDEFEWVALPPGNNNEVLRLSDDLKPNWEPLNPYRPTSMYFDGANDAYARTVSTTGNKFTYVCMFTSLPQAGTQTSYIAALHNGTAAGRRCTISLQQSSNAVFPNQLVFVAKTAAGSNLFQCIPTENYLDGKPHAVLFSFDGDAGNGKVIIDGEEKTPTVESSGTLGSGSLTFDIAQCSIFTNSNWKGHIWYFGYRDAYLTDYSAFFDDDNFPIVPDVSLWPQWGAQPLVWSTYGDPFSNHGSAGSFTRISFPYIVDPWA